MRSLKEAREKHQVESSRRDRGKAAKHHGGSRVPDFTAPIVTNRKKYAIWAERGSPRGGGQSEDSATKVATGAESPATSPRQLPWAARYSLYRPWPALSWENPEGGIMARVRWAGRESGATGQGPRPAKRDAQPNDHLTWGKRTSCRGDRINGGVAAHRRVRPLEEPKAARPTGPPYHEGSSARPAAYRRIRASPPPDAKEATRWVASFRVSISGSRISRSRGHVVLRVIAPQGQRLSTCRRHRPWRRPGRTDRGPRPGSR